MSTLYIVISTGCSIFYVNVHKCQLNLRAGSSLHGDTNAKVIVIAVRITYIWINIIIFQIAF